MASFVLAIFITPHTTYAALVEPCGLLTPSASGYFFSAYESVSYTPEGYLELHFRNQSRFSDGRGFSVSWSFLNDQCVTQSGSSTGMGMPAGVTDWSVRFTSASHFDLWDDTNNVIVTGVNITPAFPNYYRIAFRGSIDAGASFVNSRTFNIYQPGLPPEFPDTAEKSVACPDITVSGYYFDSYEHAEYVDGLLRMHLRFKTPFNDGRVFRVSGLSATDPCAFTVPTYLANPDVSVTSRVRYYSFRMTSPTHWVMWDDESDVAFTCANCQGEIPQGSAHVLWYGTIDAGASVMQTTPFPPTIAVPCADDCNSNVMFLPGIESSRLYRPDYLGGTDKLWEPGENQDIKDLYLDMNGDGLRDDVYAKSRDVLDETPVGSNVYKSFIGRMDALKADGKIADWEPIAYDWRLSLDAVLQNGHEVDARIYYTGLLAATSSPYLIQELRHLAQTSRTHKVTIVAHSNGGLLAKRLMEVLGPEASTLVDKVILVAVPQAGTPQAIAVGLHGYKQKFGFGLVMAPEVARSFASTSPMFYNLLPSLNYYTYVDDPVVTFGSTIPTWQARYGNLIHSGELLRNYLTDSYGRVDSEAGDTDQPIQFKSDMYDAAASLHAHLDSWTPPSGVSVTQIAGWGVPDTLSGITYTKKGSGVKPQPNFTIDGDGTVVVPSALWTSGVQNYWMNLRGYNNNHFLNTLGGKFPYDHSSILEANPILDYLEDLTIGAVRPIASYIYLSDSSPVNSESRLRYSLHSPLTLDMYDDFGNHTGVSTTTGQVEVGIPGTYYSEFGEAKYIFADATSPAHLYLDGYDTGTFTLNVDQLEGNTVVASTTFKDIPTTPETNAVISITSDIGTLSPLVLDKNGDGAPDASLIPKLNDVVTLDETPPLTAISLSGTPGTNGWYTSDVVATLTASDSESGVRNTYYSLDGAATTTGVSIPISGEGTHTLWYYSDDNMGNTEAATSTEVRIDTVAPEAKLIFNPSTQTLNITSASTSDQVSVVTSSTGALLTDQAGHTLQIVFSQPKPKARRAALSISKLIYDGTDSYVLGTTTLKYKWAFNTDLSYKTLAAYLASGSTLLESHYRPKKGVTILTLPLTDLDDSDSDDTSDTRPVKLKLPGRVVPYMQTDKGRVLINY